MIRPEPNPTEIDPAQLLRENEELKRESGGITGAAPAADPQHQRRTGDMWRPSRLTLISLLLGWPF